MAIKRRATTRQRPRNAQRGDRSRERLDAEQPPPEQPEAACEKGFLFDPYWDEAFAAYYDPTLRTCCTIR